MQILVTGANGFVGRALCQKLISQAAATFGVSRSGDRCTQLPPGVQPIVLPSWDDLRPLESATPKLDGIVHLAARVHQMRDRAADPLAEFRATNTLATLQLARWAAERGVGRFVFVSSIKVLGEGQDYGQIPHTYSEQDAPAPTDPYGISKLEAEQRLQQIAKETGLETVALRPTLIYGPDVKANFRQLLKLVHMGIPLPLSRVNNARSLLYLENLVDAICVSLKHPNAAGETFLVSDGEDLSTPDLIRALARGFARPARLFACPPVGLQWMGRLFGKASTVQRLLGTLRVDSQRIREKLNWTPPFTAHEGLAATAAWYQTARGDSSRQRAAA